MKRVTLRIIRMAALAAMLGGYALPGWAAPGDWRSLIDEVSVLLQDGKRDRALEVAHQAMALAETAPSRNLEALAASLLAVGVTYQRLGQHDKALGYLLRAQDILEGAAGPTHVDTAVGLNLLANSYVGLGQYAVALPLLERALSIREISLGSEHGDTGESLNNLAMVYGEMAHYEKALPLLQRALTIAEKKSGPDHPKTAWILGNIGSTYDALGQYERALGYSNRALAIREKVLGPEHPDTAKTLINLASTYGNLSQDEAALPLEQRALAINEKALGPDHPDTAWSLNNLAETYRRLHQFENSRPLLERALDIQERGLGPDHPATAGSLNNLAFVYGKLGNSEAALPLARRALAIVEKSFGHEHPRVALALNNLAVTSAELGQTAAAITFFKAAVNTYQSQRERVSSIDESALSSFTASITTTYQDLASLLIDQGLLPDAQLVLDMLKETEQFEFVRRSADADPRRTRIPYGNNEQLWISRYRQIADRLVALGGEEQALQKQAKIGLSAEQQQRMQALTADLQVARKAFESFLKEMQETFARSGPARALEIPEVRSEALRELQDLLKTMGQDTVLLQYYVTSNKVGMLLTTPGVQVARSAPVSFRDLNRQVAEFRRMLRDPKSDVLKASQALYQLLVGPVARDLEQAGAKTVMLSLDGALRYLPFGALHDGERYLVQRWSLPMYTSVTKNRLRDAAAPRWQAAGLGVTRALGEFPALPAVKTEMRSIIQAGGTGGLLPGEVHLDEAFTAQRFKDVSQRPFQLLHVASHFRFSPGTEANSFLLLGDGEQLSLGDLRTRNFRFDNVDLLTLSACDTGLGGGRDAQGREIEGFGVIAQQQGAKAVLATLWPVADESTAGLMVEMYRRRQDQRLSKIEALRQAQLSLLAQGRYAHPFYWAPFILMGNWR